MKNWFSMQAKAGAAEILIFDEIGLFGISAKQFNDQLKALGDVHAITLRINSSGGDVFDGFAIYNMLKRHKASITTIVDGLAASIASVIAMAGDKIRMPENSMILIHNPWGGVIGEADDMRDMAEALEKMKLGIIAAYRRTGKTDEEISAIMDAETWFSASEAVTERFADEVIPAVAIAARFDLSKFAHPPAALLEMPAPKREPKPAELSPAESKIVAEAKAIIAAQQESKRRQDALNEAAQIVEAVRNAGHMDLLPDFLARGLSLAEVKAELAKPEMIDSAKPSGDREELRAIYQICAKAGLPDMAESFVAQGKTVDDVQAWAANADKIRARCRAAHLPHRAESFIRAGVTPEEAGRALLELQIALNGPEIDNHFSPETSASNGARTGAGLLSTAELYRQRNARATATEADRIADAIKKALR